MIENQLIEILIHLISGLTYYFAPMKLGKYINPIHTTVDPKT